MVAIKVDKPRETRKPAFGAFRATAAAATTPPPIADLLDGFLTVNSKNVSRDNCLDR